jgi:Tol biopolymer transport system component
MALASGTRFGPYEITGQIGAGGMGEVFRATDTTLEREVAIKVLPESFATDTNRVARFEQEAKTLASLNHVNIAQVFGLERSDDTTAIVMELVEGPTLAERIADGPIPPDEALGIAIQVADALEAAHEQGIVHRDLKPANIKLKQDGTVKVLDFGIAKAFDPALAAASGQSPIMTTPVTQTGIILGTAAYMSPEQARGKAVDKRTDVWAFGCVLYEMLTGQLAFGGEDVAVTLARVIANDTDMDSLPAAISPAVQRTLTLCLEKDVTKRVRDIGDVKLALAGAFETVAPAAAEAAVPIWRRALPIAASVVIAAAAAWMLKPEPTVPPPQVARFDIPLAAGQTLRNTVYDVIAVSPDGTKIVYNTSDGLVLRSLDAFQGRTLPGTQQNMAHPFFSPDGEWIAFFDGQLKKIRTTGGAPVVLGTHRLPVFGATWSPDGANIIFGQAEGIVSVPADGGPTTLLVAAADGEELWDPQFLPDRDGSILFTRAQAGSNDVFVQAPGAAEAHRLVQAQRAIYVPTGHLIVDDRTAGSNTLFGRTFDLDSLEVGGLVPIVEGVEVRNGRMHHAIAAGGTLVYLQDIPGGLVQADVPDLLLTMIDREGNRSVLDVPARPYRSPRLSPDGTRIAVEIVDPGGRSSIWVYDLSGDSDIRRLTQVGDGNNFRPVWTPDGERLAFASDRDGPISIYSQPADGRGPAERLTEAESGTSHVPESWSVDGVLSFALVQAATIAARRHGLAHADGPEPGAIHGYHDCCNDRPDQRRRELVRGAQAARADTVTGPLTARYGRRLHLGDGGVQKVTIVGSGDVGRPGQARRRTPLKVKGFWAVRLAPTTLLAYSS